MSKPSNPQEIVHDVIIIGAGISGISTAYHLLLNNFDGKILILEGRDRIGGRISGQTSRFDGQQIELGANWIHGIMGNPIYHLADKYKIVNQLVDLSGKSDMQDDVTSFIGGEDKNVRKKREGGRKKHIVEARDENGRKVDMSLVREAYQAYFYFVKSCENYFIQNDINGDNHVPMSEFENSVGKHLQQDIDAWIKSKNCEHDEKMIMRSIFDSLLMRETSISGSHSMDEVSLTDFGSYSECPGGNVIIPHGFIQIVDCLVTDIEKALKKRQEKKNQKSICNKEEQLKDSSNEEETKQIFSIKKCHKVKQIKWKRTKETAKDGEKSIPSSNVIEIECENGSIFYGYHCVITLPLGVLKAEAKTLFVPQLPSYKLESINSLAFGIVNKIFLEYSMPLSDDYFPDGVNELLVLRSDKDVAKHKDSTPNWCRKIFSFQRISKHVLLTWITGEEAIQVEQVADEEVNRELTSILRRFLLCPNYPLADHVIVTKWYHDVFSRGSYSFINKNGSHKDIEMLSQPIYNDSADEKPSLVFAGEATHGNFYSTTHGAFLSGRKAAYYLLDADQVDGIEKKDSNFNPSCLDDLKLVVNN